MTNTTPEPKTITGPTKKRAAPKKASPAEGSAKTAPKKEPRSLYLPSLPTGWSYSMVKVEGPGTEIVLSAADGAISVATISESVGNSTQTAANMKDAAETASSVAKTAEKIVAAEAAVSALRQEAAKTLQA